MTASTALFPFSRRLRLEHILLDIFQRVSSNKGRCLNVLFTALFLSSESLCCLAFRAKWPRRSLDDRYARGHWELVAALVAAQ